MMAVASRDVSRSKTEGRSDVERQLMEEMGILRSAFEGLKQQVESTPIPPPPVPPIAAIHYGYTPSGVVPRVGAYGDVSRTQGSSELPKHTGAGRPPLVCYGCQQPGHVRSQCPTDAHRPGAGGDAGQVYMARSLRCRRFGGRVAMNARSNNPCQAKRVIPLMSLVIERKFQLPVWMEPPRSRSTKDGVSSRGVAPTEEVRVNGPIVAPTTEVRAPQKISGPADLVPASEFHEEVAVNGTEGSATRADALTMSPLLAEVSPRDPWNQSAPCEVGQPRECVRVSPGRGQENGPVRNVGSGRFGDRCGDVRAGTPTFGAWTRARMSTCP